MLTADRAREVLQYDRESGILKWRERTSNRIKIGDIAGTPNSKGHLVVRIDKILYMVHRVIWLMETGNWPVGEIDHWDLNGTNNCFDNLRDATSSQNSLNQSRRTNNTSGYKGVSWDQKKSKWCARITVNNKRKFLGYFDDPCIAHDIYMKTAVELAGPFARSS